MHSERTRKAWLRRAERIYDEISQLNGFEQAEAFREHLDKISDGSTRSAVEMQVWYWIGHGKKSLHREWLTANTILAFTFVALFLVGWIDLGFSLVWAGTLALIVTVIVRFVFRLFDRGFMFRRLFIACVSSGLLLIGPAQLQFEFATLWGPISWGGAPSGALVMVWVLCTLLTFVVAVWEHFVSDRT